MGAAALATVFFAGGCSFSVGSSDSVTKPDDAAPGTCVSLSGTDAKNMTVKKVSCDGGTELTFYSAGTIAKTGKCATADYTTLSFPDTDTQLCMALNMAQGSCYQINPNDIADYRRIDCGTAGKAGTSVYKVASRTDGTASCTTGQQAVDYTQPKAIGYCLEAAG
ncbi:hypothetical protein HH308_09950 [Gordonia sp. TBRC 11910]|uniref:Pyridine nucleotide-disulfide oxidoreductase n=1 Tax=Gordonia asplenii TaxID=2725283 RepID=A0A848KRE4_9ACTN|nr:hypothetical protein [Gordonia asplenii]NMO01534.1 hypothetical protein [Gordonia asplenii]